MSRRLVRTVARLALVGLSGLFLAGLAALASAFMSQAGEAWAAPTPTCAVTGTGPYTANISLTGAKVTLSTDSGGNLYTATGSATPVQCGAVPLGSTSGDITTINFSATGTSQTVVIDQSTSGSGSTPATPNGAFPCGVTFSSSGSVSAGTVTPTNALMDIIAAPGSNVTVGSDGINLDDNGSCASAGAPGGIGSFELVGDGTGTLSALGGSGTNPLPASTPVTFIAGLGIETFKPANPGTTLDFSQVSCSGCFLDVNTTASTQYEPVPPGNSTSFLVGMSPNTAAISEPGPAYAYYDFSTNAPDINDIIGLNSSSPNCQVWISVATTYSGSTCFIAGSSSGYTFSEPSGKTGTADFANASPVTVDLSSGTSGTVSLSGGHDNISGLTYVIGSDSGGNTFTAGPSAVTFIAGGNSNSFTGGSGTDTFTANGNSNTFKAGTGTETFNSTGTGNTFDFSALTSDLTLNMSSGTATVGGNYTFPVAPAKFIGSQAATKFVADSTGGYTFQGSSGSDSADFSGLANGITANLASTPGAVTIPGSASTDSLTGIATVIGSNAGGNTFIGGSQPVTFKDLGVVGNDTFKAGTGNETFVGSGSNNKVDFSALSTSLTINVPAGTASSSGATYTFTSLGATPTTFVGSTGGTTFQAGSTGGYIFVGSGGTTVADFSSDTNPVTANLSGNNYVTTSGGSGATQVTIGGGQVLVGALPASSTSCAAASPAICDTISGITSIIGSSGGHNVFVAGSTAETFGDTGGTGQDTIDFTNVGTSSSAPLTVNASGGPVFAGSTLVNNYTAVVGSTTYTFSSTGSDFKAFIGSSTGNTNFLAGSTGGYTFCTVEAAAPGSTCGQAVQTSDTVDFSAAPTGTAIDLSTGPQAGVASIPSSSADFVNGFVNIIGPLAGGATFKSGPGPSLYKFTGNGNSNVFEAGTGSAVFVGSGSGNTVDFSQSFGPTAISPVTVNVSGVQVGSVVNGTATAGGSTYTFTSFVSQPTTFIGGVAGTTFYAGTTGDTFNGDPFAPADSNILSFADASGSSLTICTVSTSLVSACSPVGTAAVLGSTREPFSGITQFNGLQAGNTTFVGGDPATNLQFNATGSGNSADFSATIHGVMIDLSQTPAVVTFFASVFTVHMTGISSVVGSQQGNNIFIAGFGSESFADIGTNGGDSIDFSKIGTSSSAPLTINVSGGPVSTASSGTVANYTAAVGNSTVYSFQNAGVTNGGNRFKVFIGSNGGYTNFLGGPAGGYRFCASPGTETAGSQAACGTSGQLTDVLDLSAGSTGMTVDLSSGPSSGTVTIPSTSPDSVQGVTFVIGSSLGGTTFKGDSLGTPYSFTAAGTGNDFIVGTGSETIVDPGAGNTIDFHLLSASLTVNVSGVQEGTIPNDGAFAGSTYTFGSAPTTFVGSQGSTVFFAGSTADGYNGYLGATNTLDFTNVSSSGPLFFCLASPTSGACSGSAGDAVLGSIKEPFSNITVFKGLTSGNTTFVAGDSSGGYSFIGFGSNNTADFSPAASGVTADLSAGTAKFAVSPQDSLSGITTVIGSSHGGNKFVAGSSNETFGDACVALGTCTHGPDTIDFSAVPTSSGSPLTINVSAVSFNGTASDTATAGALTYAFTQGGTNFTLFTGSSSGNTRFVAPNQVGGYTFSGQGGNNTADFSASTIGITANLSPNSEDGLPACPSGATLNACEVFVGGTGSTVDTLEGSIATVVGSPTVANVFYGGLHGTAFVSQASGNDLSYAGMITPVTINLPNGTVSGSGATDTFSFGSSTNTFQGSSAAPTANPTANPNAPGNDVFVIGTGPAILQSGGNYVTLDLTALNSALSGAASGVIVDLVSGQITGPSPFNGVTIDSPGCGTGQFCVTAIKGTNKPDTYILDPGALTNPVLVISGGNSGANTLDLGNVSAAATVSMPYGANRGTVAPSSSASSITVVFTGISNVSGTISGNDHIYAGTGTESFTETGTTATLDFSHLSSGTAGVAISAVDSAGNFIGTVSSPVQIGATDAFTGFNTFIGTSGSDVFAETGPAPAGGYLFYGGAGSNTVDLSSIGVSSPAVRLGATASPLTCPGTSDGTVKSGSTTELSFFCASTVSSGPAAYSVTPGSGAAIQGGGSSTLQLLNATSGATIDLSSGTGEVSGGGSPGYSFSFTGMSSVTGTAFNDLFIAGPGNFSLIGGGGSDGISFAGAPAAVVVNDSGATYTIPGSSTTVAPFTATGGYGGTIKLSGISNILGSAASNDILVAGSGSGTLIGGAGNVRFVLTAGSDYIYAGTGSNMLDLSLLPGQTAVDLGLSSLQPLGTGDGYLALAGGTILTVIASPGGSQIWGGSGNLTIVGGSGNDWLAAGTGTQTLTGGGGSDTLVGGVGTDTLQGGSNPVTFVAGDGSDTLTSATTGNTLDYSSAPSGVDVNLSSQLVSIPAGEPLAGTTLAPLTATGGWGANVNLTNAGVSNVNGSSQNDIFVTGAGGSNINGVGGSDLFVVEGGNNTLTAAPNSQTRFIFEGAGNNLISGGGNATVDFSQAPARVTVNLQTGNATGGWGGFQQLSGVLNIIGSNFNDVLVAGAPGGTIIGLNGNDLLQAGPSGGDTLFSGGNGNDTFCAQSSCAVAGTIAGGGDTMIGGSGNDVFFAENGVGDTINGGGGFNSAFTDPTENSVVNIQQQTIG